jgi:hypothetical protein
MTSADFDAADSDAADFDSDGEDVRRDRSEHGGASARPDDDELQRRTERERVDAGLEDYDPDDVPPASDVDEPFDPTSTEEFAEEKGEAARQAFEGELYPIDDEHPFPPSHYDRS